ncbi:unnamed protein product [Cylicocyclus nassatus]|nr:unnamed protein product [Cylicocyclus nassatus]
MMITAPFFSGAVVYNPEDSEMTYEALVLGLGGGVINSFLSDIRVTSVDNDPVMISIAKKWYQLKESPRHKVVIDDAIHFVQDEASKGSKYDVILVDVCYNKLRSVLCPIDEFLNDTVIKQMSAILKDHGAIVVNVIPSRGTSAYDEIKHTYSRHLPSCYLMKISGSQILICSKIENNAWDTNRKKIAEVFEIVDNDFVFSIAQYAIAMTDNSTISDQLN